MCSAAGGHNVRRTVNRMTVSEELLLLTPEPTLHEFVIKLLADTSCREAFDLDPAAALRHAGLADVTPEDVLDAIPLVLDLASAGSDGLSVDGGVTAGLSGVSGSGVLASPAGSGAFGFSAGPREAAFAATFDSGPADGDIATAATADDLSLTFGLDLDPDDLDLRLPGLDPLGLGPDALGRGGDAVSGAVAGYAGGGIDTLSGLLTEDAGDLTGGTNAVSGLVAAGAGTLTGPVHLPAVPAVPELPVTGPVAVPDLPTDLPVGVPAVPGLPDLGDLPLDLPVDLPDLPVDLPQLPGVPELPQLPSLPGVDIVQDTVGGVTSHLPVVGELTDGLDNHLPFGH